MKSENGGMAAHLLKQVAALQLGADPDDAQLTAVGQLMLAWVRAAGVTDDLLARPQAVAQQELLYPLDVAPGQPALYLVSDGPGVDSAPHEHTTWAVIVGLSGNERNTLYRLDRATGSLQVLHNVDIKRDDVIHLRADAIHSTVAVDNVATFHLHLYGKPLDELPPYACRCYPTAR